MTFRSRQIEQGLAALAVGLAAVGPCLALPQVRQRAQVVLHVQVILVAPPAAGRTIASRTLTLDRTQAKREQIEVAWPGEATPTLLSLSATGRPGSYPDRQTVELTSSVGRPGGQALATESTYALRDGSSQLVEVYAHAGVRLLLALSAERLTEPVVGPSAGDLAQVRFQVAVQYVHAETVEVLETNVLDTFLGETVEYSFERGEGDALETLRIALLPIRLEGSIAEVEVVIDGTLPAPTNRVVVSRRERLLTTRGSASAVVVSAGDPPSGYRFEIRPDW
jgi:hypothetical protein